MIVANDLVVEQISCWHMASGLYYCALIHMVHVLLCLGIQPGGTYIIDSCGLGLDSE